MVMETLLHGNNNQTFAENKKNPNKEEASPQPPSPSSPPPRPSSTSSSPSHEFSFTVSLQSLSSSSSSSSPIPNPNGTRNTNRMVSSHQQPLFAVDLSPADEIFFHGHLLPLHFLSHLPISPRTSTTSLDGITLPVKNSLHDQSTSTTILHTSSKNGMTVNTHGSSSIIKNKAGFNVENRVKTKPNKSFSLFGLSKRPKGFEERGGEEEEEEEEKEKQKKKVMGLDHLSHAFKKYVRMLFQRRENGTQLKKRQAYSFSSASVIGSRKNNNIANNINGYKRDLRGRRGEFSAPASMRTSPTNSGHLLASTSGLSSASNPYSSVSDSTMEELQAAIQAAIAHCKNSFSVDQDKVKNS